MTGASTEIFQTFSISMAMQKIEEELRDLRNQVISEYSPSFLFSKYEFRSGAQTVGLT